MVPVSKENAFDDTMVAITGKTKRSGELKNCAFPIERFFPVEERAGDIFIFYPLFHRDKIYGYMVFLNEYFPIEVYNYRICHEGICSSIENLHRQMILKSSIKELDSLHMHDQMTGLYNRFALNRFQADYVDDRPYSVAMMDMDHLKYINDSFGHLSGNHAICITADAITESVEESDLVIRYGGDEFQVISHHTQPEYWKNLCVTINDALALKKNQQKLPYELGISIGYAISTADAPLSFTECCELADREMYQNKKMRKCGRL